MLQRARPLVGQMSLEKAPVSIFDSFKHMMFTVFRSEFYPLLILRSWMPCTCRHGQWKTLRLAVVAFHMVDRNILLDALETWARLSGTQLDYAELEVIDKNFMWIYIVIKLSSLSRICCYLWYILIYWKVLLNKTYLDSFPKKIIITLKAVYLP